MLRTFNSRPAQAAGPGWIHLLLFFGVFALKFQESDLLVDGLFSLNYGPGGLRYSPLCSGPREGSPETADPRRSCQQVQGGGGSREKEPGVQAASRQVQGRAWGAGRWGRPWGMEEDSWQDGSWPWRRRQGTLTPWLSACGK